MKKNVNDHSPDPLTNLLRDAIASEPLPPADPDLRAAVLKRLDQPPVEPALSVAASQRRRTFFQRAGIALVSTAALAMAAVIWQRPDVLTIGLSDSSPSVELPILDNFGPTRTASRPHANSPPSSTAPVGGIDKVLTTGVKNYHDTLLPPDTTHSVSNGDALKGRVEENPAQEYRSTAWPKLNKGYGKGGPDIAAGPTAPEQGGRPASATAGSGGGGYGQPQPGGQSAPAPYYAQDDIQYHAPAERAPSSRLYESREKWRESKSETDNRVTRTKTLEDGLSTAKTPAGDQPLAERRLALLQEGIENLEARGDEAHRFRYAAPQVQNGEQYAKIVENPFLAPKVEPLSTFSIDVDTASYANVRRFLNNGQLPPPDAVRLEELVNYFKYKYPQPKGNDPFSVNMEMADCPWQPGHKLLRVGLQGKEIHRAERPASNIVLLIDTSGSMTDQNKLPLLKQAFTLLVSELGENDKVTIVTYAGNAGLRLGPTRGDKKETILAAIEGMTSGGSTHGSAGITLAYEQAAAQFIKGGTNKVILATDGDLNVGITDDAALVELITKKAETGVFLTVLGVGTGNLKDAKMERLADNGNGIYAYLDSVREARKVLVEEMSGSLVTIAKDVKIQIEFNPAQIQAFRLLGYENRILAHQDFNNDQKDAGEIGAGHSVTALYEVAMVGAPEVKAPSGEPLKYQQVPAEKPAKELTEAAKNGELLTLKLRYKQPEGKESKLIEFALKDRGGQFNSASPEFQFSSAVVAFGLVLRNSEHRGSANLSAVSEIAGAVTGEDIGGHRAEFLDLVRRAKALRGQ